MKHSLFHISWLSVVVAKAGVVYVLHAVFFVLVVTRAVYGNA